MTFLRSCIRFLVIDNLIKYITFPLNSTSCHFCCYIFTKFLSIYTHFKLLRVRLSLILTCQGLVRMTPICHTTNQFLQKTKMSNITSTLALNGFFL